METVRIIEAFRNLFYSPLYVAQSLRLFEAEELSVAVWTRVPGEDVLVMLKAGVVDVALTGPMRSLVAADAGETELPLSFIEVNSRDGFMLLSRKPVERFDWHDLEGRAVLTYREPPTPWMCLLHVLEEQGVARDRVQLSTDRSIPDAMAAFRDGVGDYIELPEPQAEEFIAAGLAHLATPMGRFAGTIPYTSFAATRDYLDGRRDVALRFARAVYAAQRWLTAASPEAVAIQAAASLPGVPFDVLTRGAERYLAQDTWSKDPLIRRKGFDRFQDILREGGLIQGRHRYEDQVTTALAEAVMAENASD